MPNLKDLTPAKLRKLAEKAKIPNWETLERDELLKALSPKEEKKEEVKKEEEVKEEDKTDSGEDEVVEYKDMKIPELRNIAKSKGVDIKGLKKKVDIVKAIEKAIKDGDEEIEDNEETEEDKVVTFGVEEARFKRGGKAERMKKKLGLQPKVSIIISLADKEPRGSTETVILNGYRLNIRKGEYVDVPKQIADIIKKSQRQTVIAIEHENLLGDNVNKSKSKALGL